MDGYFMLEVQPLAILSIYFFLFAFNISKDNYSSTKKVIDLFVSFFQ